MIKAKSGTLLFSKKSGAYHIEVREDKAYRWLHFGGDSIQSAMNRASESALTLPYMPLVTQGLALFHPQPKHALLLGLGGAGLIRYWRAHNPSLHIDTVEINSDIIDIAHHYFSCPRSDDTFQIYCDDAYTFLQHSEQYYDTIIADFYGNESLPEALQDLKFYEQCHAHLQTGGLLITNLVCESPENFLTLVKKIREAFDGKTLSINVKNYRNIIVFAFKNEQFSKTIDKLMTENKLKRPQYDIEFGLYIDSFN